MSAPFWVFELTAMFWKSAGDHPFPRELTGLIARALPLSVAQLPDLSVAGVDRWLGRQGVICALGTPASPGSLRTLR